MKITCESCGAKYTIADDKVRGRKVKIRCKGCGTPIVVDGQQSAPPNGDSSAASEGDAAVSEELPQSLPPDGEWSVNLSDTEQLSLTTAQVVEGWKSGRIGSDAFVWRDGMGDWLPILESPDLAPLLPKATASEAAAPAAEPTPSEAAAPEPERPKSISPAGASQRPVRAIKPSGAAARGASVAARVSGGRAQGAPDLFAGVDKAGSDDEEISTSAPVLPQAGGGAKHEEKPTGARNENSVLFSLDALKAGFAGAPPKAAVDDKKKATGAGASDDPFGMGGGTPLMAGLGAGNTLFSLAENQALLTAPPPPDPPKPVVQSYAPSGAPGAAAPPAKKKTLLFAAGGIGVLAVGLALGAGLSGGKEEKVEKVESETPAAVEKPADRPSEPEKSAAAPEKKEEPVSDPTKKEEPATEAASAEAKPGDKSGDTQPATTTTPSPSKGSSSSSGSTASKESAKPAAKEEPKAAAASAAQPFNKGAAVSALSAAAAQAPSCKKIGGPTGSGKVQVTFAPSGRVTSATVTGAPFAGTSVGGCVASVFRRSKVPPFSGSSVTVAKSFAIR